MTLKIIKFLAAAMLLSSWGCNCVQDVTNDPAFGFSGIRGRLFITKTELIVYKFNREDARKLELAIAPAGMSESGSMPIAIEPIGTLLRPLQLLGEFCESGSLVVHMRIESGRFAGQMATASISSEDLFVDPTAPTTTGTRPVDRLWHENPRLLQIVTRH